MKADLIEVAINGVIMDKETTEVGLYYRDLNERRPTFGIILHVLTQAASVTGDLRIP